MARPPKDGLAYFPLDVAFDSDDKILLIEQEVAERGCWTLLKLVAKIYSEGYYYRWGEKEELLFARTRVSGDINHLRAVVSSAVKWGFFAANLFEKHGILTSAGIQRRYLEAVRKRATLRLVREYLLIDCGNRPTIPLDGFPARKCQLIDPVTPVSAPETLDEKSLEGVSGGITPVSGASGTQSKVKKSKEKESEAHAQSAPLTPVSAPETKDANPDGDDGPDRSADEYLELARSFLEEPDGQPWVNSSLFMTTGRRPLRKYPDMKMTEMELADIFAQYDRTIPREEWPRAFKSVNGRLQSIIGEGRSTDHVSVVNWLSGWAYKELLDALTSERRLQRLEARAA